MLRVLLICSKLQQTAVAAPPQSCREHGSGFGTGGAGFGLLLDTRGLKRRLQPPKFSCFEAD